jgi:hypothetical protein
MTTVSATRSATARPRLETAPRRAHLLPFVTVVCVVLLLIGYSVRDEMYLTPDEGLGYGLGVIGLAALTSLLLYSVRKRVRALWTWGPLRHWFHVHMLLGVVGPALILFHANFQVHSTNAAVALAAMLIVASSGFIGRFAYSRVHRGLFGQRETLRDVTERAQASRSALHEALRALPEVEACVREFEQRALAPAHGALAGLLRALELGRRTRSAQRRARALLREAPLSSLPAGAEPVARALRAHLALVRRVAEFGFYEGVLALWHALHVPLCVVLFMAAAIHVVAVHLY